MSSNMHRTTGKKLPGNETKNKKCKKPDISVQEWIYPLLIEAEVTLPTDGTLVIVVVGKDLRFLVYENSVQTQEGEIEHHLKCGGEIEMKNGKCVRNTLPRS